jgi:hypothetical protein
MAQRKLGSMPCVASIDKVAAALVLSPLLEYSHEHFRSEARVIM